MKFQNKFVMLGYGLKEFINKINNFFIVHKDIILKYRYSAFIVILAIILFFEVIFLIPEDIYQIKTMKYSLKTQKNEIIIGKDRNCDISLIDPKISVEHLKLSFRDSIIVLTNISDYRKVDFNDEYLSTTRINQGDQIEILNKKFQVINHPRLWFLGIKVDLKDENDHIISVRSIMGKIIYPELRLNLPNAEYYQPHVYFKVEFEKSWIMMLNDVSVIFLFVFLVLLIIVLINRFGLLNYDLLKKNEVLITIAVLAFLCIVAFLISSEFTYVDLKLLNFNRNDQAAVKINGVSPYRLNRVMEYNHVNSANDSAEEVNSKMDELILGRTHYKISIEKNGINKKIMLYPLNEYIFRKSTGRKVENIFLFPKGNKVQTLDFSENDDLQLRNLIEDTLDLRFIPLFYRTNQYLVYIAVFVIVNMLFILFLSKRFSSTYFAIFTFILLHGVILLDQFSLYSPRFYNLINVYQNNILLGISNFFLILFGIRILMDLSRVSSITYLPISKTKGINFGEFDKYLIGFTVLLIFTIAGIVFITGNYLISSLIIVSICLIIFSIVNAAERAGSFYGDSKGQLSDLFLTERFTENHFLIMLLFILIAMSVQVFKGGELGFYFLGTNIQLFEAFKILLTMIIIASYFSMKKLNHPFPLISWLIIIPFMFVLIFMLNDLSPLLIFSFLMIYHFFLHQNDTQTGNAKLIANILIFILIFISWIALANNYYLLFVIIAVLELIMVVFLKWDKPSRNKLLIFIIVILIFVSAVSFIPGKISSRYNLSRIIEWQNHWQYSNHQFLQSYVFINQDNEIIPDMDSVPALKDDMIFAWLINRLGIGGLTVILSILFLLLVKAFRMFVKAKSENSEWCAWQIMFLTLLFISQTFIALSNVTGLLPIMGQPAPGLSYTASNLIFFYFGIFALLIQLDNEYRRNY